MSSYQVYPTSRTLAIAAAEHFVSLAREAVAAREQFNVALAGGSTPRTTYTLLAEPPFAAQVDWSRVQIFWGDERCVPPAARDSNYRMAWETLLSQIPIPAQNIHRIKGELPPQQAASAYQCELEAVLGPAGRFDLIWLGLGTDGHTASLFPDTRALAEQERWVRANYVERLASWRITLTLPIINAARQVTFLVSGENKLQALNRIQAGERLPAALVNPLPGKLRWLLDAAAAGPNGVE